MLEQTRLVLLYLIVNDIVVQKTLVSASSVLTTVGRSGQFSWETLLTLALGVNNQPLLLAVCGRQLLLL